MKMLRHYYNLKIMDNVIFCANLCKLSYAMNADEQNEILLGLNVPRQQCTFMQKANAKGLKVNKGNTLYIAWCGTDDIQDQWDDLNMQQMRLELDGAVVGSVHCGFYSYYSHLHDEVVEAVRTFFEHHNGQHASVVFTGHSLGSCVAFAALECKMKFPSVQIEYISFGSPRLGDQVFVSSLEKTLDKCVRVYNGNDMVTKLPAGFGYKHIEKETICIAKRTLTFNDIIRRIFPYSCSKPNADAPKEDLFKEHYINAYIVILMNMQSPKRSIANILKDLVTPQVKM